ncbi:MAG: hypothetical protein OXR66_09400 [Candidatus Woesearchaeota archaeon]|nr:hypothetical protein [Candidatus Woesearchaeota archaeon]
MTLDVYICNPMQQEINEIKDALASYRTHAPERSFECFEWLDLQWQMGKSGIFMLSYQIDARTHGTELCEEAIQRDPDARVIITQNILGNNVEDQINASRDAGAYGFIPRKKPENRTAPPTTKEIKFTQEPDARYDPNTIRQTVAAVSRGEKFFP